MFLLSSALEVRDLDFALSLDFWALLTAFTAANVVLLVDPNGLASRRSVRDTCQKNVTSMSKIRDVVKGEEGPGPLNF